jgi:hypothetical protein
VHHFQKYAKTNKTGEYETKYYFSLKFFLFLFVTLLERKHGPNLALDHVSNWSKPALDHSPGSIFIIIFIYLFINFVFNEAHNLSVSYEQVTCKYVSFYSKLLYYIWIPIAELMSDSRTSQMALCCVLYELLMVASSAW